MNKPFNRRIFKKLLLAPFNLIMGTLEDIDRGELDRIIDKRVARAENAVMRDYLAQHGVEGEDAEAAMEELRAERRGRQPSGELVDSLRKRAEDAEAKARGAQIDAEARVQLTRLGVLEEHSEDVLRLASRELDAARQNGDTGAVRTALEAVVARLPMVAGDGGITTGTPGNFPRPDAGAVMQRELDNARRAGNNAEACAIISRAAVRGIRLR